MSETPAVPFVPTEPGYYWFRDTPSELSPSETIVLEVDEQFKVWRLGSEIEISIEDALCNGNFLGPVAPPEFTLPSYQFLLKFEPTEGLYLPKVKGFPINAINLTVTDVTTEITRTEAHLSKLLGVSVKIEQVK